MPELATVVLVSNLVSVGDVSSLVSANTDKLIANIAMTVKPVESLFMILISNYCLQGAIASYINLDTSFA